MEGMDGRGGGGLDADKCVRWVERGGGVLLEVCEGRTLEILGFFSPSSMRESDLSPRSFWRKAVPLWDSSLAPRRPSASPHWLAGVSQNPPPISSKFWECHKLCLNTFRIIYNSVPANPRRRRPGPMLRPKLACDRGVRRKMHASFRQQPSEILPIFITQQLARAWTALSYVDATVVPPPPRPSATWSGSALVANGIRLVIWPIHHRVMSWETARGTGK